MMGHRILICPSSIQDRRAFRTGRPALLCRIVGMRLVRGYAISANVRSAAKRGCAAISRAIDAAASGASDQIQRVRRRCGPRRKRHCALCVLLYVSDQIVADPKLQVLKPGQGQNSPREITQRRAAHFSNGPTDVTNPEFDVEPRSDFPISPKTHHPYARQPNRRRRSYRAS